MSFFEIHPDFIIENIDNEYSVKSSFFGRGKYKTSLESINSFRQNLLLICGINFELLLLTQAASGYIRV